MDDNKKKLLEALIEKPSTYHIEVMDNSMLPENLKRRKEISFSVKPPSLDTLAKVALIMEDVPDDIKSGENISISEATKYTGHMVKAICTMAWGKSGPYPDWYEDFILKNAEPADIYKIGVECSLKQQTDFFLTSFQVVGENPMMMKKRNVSTPMV